MQLDETGYLHSSRINSLAQDYNDTEKETEKRKFLTLLVKEIIRAINEKAITDNVDINNFDEVTASLRNELSRANKPITNLLNKLNVSTEQQTKLIKDIEEGAKKDFKQEYQTVVIKRIKDIVSVDNLNEIAFPPDVRINNLDDLSIYLKDISTKIQALKLSVNIPPTQVNVPPVDLNILLEGLNGIINSLKIIKINNKSHPLAVRLTDGGDWVKQLVKIQQETSKAVTAFAGGSNQVRILDANMQVISPTNLGVPSVISDGSQTVTTAGTRVQLSSTSVPCRYVIIVGNATNTGYIYIGGSAVSSTSGRPIVALQSEKIDIDNLNKVWIDSSANGEGVTYAYVA